MRLFGQISPRTIAISHLKSSSTTRITTAFHSSAYLKTMESTENNQMATRIEQVLTTEFKPAHLEVVDASGGCGQSFQVVIVSDLFAGKSVLQRHRMVNDKLKGEISQLHAFSQKCLTPEQWKEQ